MLNDWVNSKYIENSYEYSKEFENNKPFAHLNLNNFFIEEKLEDIYEEIKNLDFYLEDHDLYQFLRTVDFKNLKNNEKISNFYNFIFSKEFISFIEEITNTKLSTKKGDLHSLRLQNTHYLLCHDDQVENRYLAFVINLSKDFKKDNGGSLDLFESENSRPKKIAKSIFPQFNQFNIFLVNDKSFHQISEVIGEVNRESISGWFYK